MKRRKLHGERNNARYYFWSKKRKTKNTLADGLTGNRLLKSVEDRRQWRKIIHEAANPQIEDG